MWLSQSGGGRGKVSRGGGGENRMEEARRWDQGPSGQVFNSLYFQLNKRGGKANSRGQVLSHAKNYDEK